MRNPDLASQSNILSVSKSITLVTTAVTTITTARAIIIWMIDGKLKRRLMQRRVSRLTKAQVMRAIRVSLRIVKAHR